MELIKDGKKRGICGEKVNFTDSVGNELCVGDVVIIAKKHFERMDSFRIGVIVKDNRSGEYEVSGIFGEAKKGFVNNLNWDIYKTIPHFKISVGSSIAYYKYIEEVPKKKMTIEEIEEKLGYSIEIINK